MLVTDRNVDHIKKDRISSWIILLYLVLQESIIFY